MILQFPTETVREDVRRERLVREPVPTDALADLERRRRCSPAVKAAISQGGKDVNSGSAADRAAGMLPDDPPEPPSAA